MATAPAKTIKITQTIRLDIDFANVEAVRIVDVDLLILLKDGQRLIIPEGAVRAMMDTEFSINFKGRQMSVASLMSLQTFEAQRVTEIGIASTPKLPESNKSQPKPAQDVDRLMLDGGGEVGKTTSTPEPVSQAQVTPVPQGQVRASTEADTLARQEASALDQQARGDGHPLGVPGSAPTPETQTSPAASGPAGPTSMSTATTASTSSVSGSSGTLSSPAAPPPAMPVPESAPAEGMSSIWKYAVGILGAGMAAVAGRGVSKTAEAVAEATGNTPLSDFLNVSGTIALGPIKASQVTLQVLGRDASGKTIRLSGVLDSTVTNDAYDLAKSKTTVNVDTATGVYSIKLNVKSYSGPIVLVLTDANGSAADYLDEATRQDLSLNDLHLRSSGVISGNTASTVNITPLTELAVRSALSSDKTATVTSVPANAAQVEKANVAIAKAFGLGADANVATSAVTTVVSTGFKVDGSVQSKYALALAALSGLDSQQTSDPTKTPVQQTLDSIAESFVSHDPLSQGTLSSSIQEQVIKGALQSQPVVRNQTGDAALNVSQLVAEQIALTSAVTNVTVLVASSSTSLGLAGQTVTFHFNQSMPRFTAADVQLDRAGFSLDNLHSLDAQGKVWAAQVTAPVGAAGAVKLNVLPTAWRSTAWTWEVDMQAPTAPTPTLVNTATGDASDSGTSATDGISNVKTPRVRIALQPDTQAGDTITLTQTDKTSHNPILDSQGVPRNQITLVLGLGDVQQKYLDVDLKDMGGDGDFWLSVTQRDAAGNSSATTSLSYSLLTQIPLTPALALKSGQVYLGDNTSPGILNFKTKELGFTLTGTGGSQGARVAINWGGRVKETTANADGSWSMTYAKDDVPGDGLATVMSLSQVDVAGNRSAIQSYTVEVATAGVKAKVLSLGIEDNSTAVAAGGYSSNAQGAVGVQQSTDDTSPGLVIRLDQNLLANEVIEIYDGTLSAVSQPLLRVSGSAQAIENNQFIWRIADSDWASARTLLKTGVHQLTARVTNTHTLDEGVELVAANRPSFVVQALNFNQLLLVENGDNQIPVNQSAGQKVLDSLPVNKPILGGTLMAPLGQGERLAVYDTYQGSTHLLGAATLTEIKDSANNSTGTYTWRYMPTTGLANGAHTLSVRLETVSDTPAVRLAMAQEISVTLPILSIAPAASSPNGVSTDTGVSDNDGISNNRTPFLRLVFPVSGRRVGDTVTVIDTVDNKVVATQTLTQEHLRAGMIEFSTSTLGTGNSTDNKTLNLVARISSTSGGLPVPDSAPLVYVLDIIKPDAPVLDLQTDTSGSAYYTRIPTLKPIAYDPSQRTLQYEVKRNGVTVQAFSTTAPNILTDGTQDGTYTISARFIDVAGNVSTVTLPTTASSNATGLGMGVGTLKFVLDTIRPAVLSRPSLQLDTTNGLNGFDRDNVTSNFRLSDEQPTVEKNATYEYSVQYAGNSSNWVATYLDAIGLVNGLSGQALLDWKNLGTEQQAKALGEGLYSVKRRQIDQAGNISVESGVLSFYLDIQATPLTVSLLNDTSNGRLTTSDARISLAGLDGTTGVDLKLVYELTRYTDNTRTVVAPNGLVATTNAYTPPTQEGYYSLKVTQTNKAGLSSSSTLNFVLDKTAPDAPGALALESSSDTHRDTISPVGVGDNSGADTAPTLRLALTGGSNAAKVGDRLELYLDGDLSKPWGVKVLTDDDLSHGAVPVSVNSLAPTSDQAVGSTDGRYTFRARWVDAAGNASALGPEFQYTLDTKVDAPTIDPIQLAGLPQNLINHQPSVTFTGTSQEPGSLITLTWGGKDFTTTVNNSGRWSLTLQRTGDAATNQFPPDTARLAFESTVSVRQTDPSGNVSSVSTLQLALNTTPMLTTATIDRIDDSNRQITGSSGVATPTYAVDATGAIPIGHTTTEYKPVLFGRLSQALVSAARADGSDQPVLRVYDGGVLLGVAVVSGLDWSFALTSALTDGAHAFSVELYDPLTLQTGIRSSAYGLSCNVLTLNIRDAAHPAEWLISDTATPTIDGVLRAPLASGEQLVVYDRAGDGSWVRLGVVDQFTPLSSGVNWTFDMPNPMHGVHLYRVQVETLGGQVLMAVDQAVRYNFNSLELAAGSDSGASDHDGISNVRAPTATIRLSSAARVGEWVKLKLGSQALTDSAYQRQLTAADLAAGFVEIRLPDLWAMQNASGVALGDRSVRINATVGSASVVSDLVYTLDTTKPSLTPQAVLHSVTGGVTGFTNDAKLDDSTVGLSGDPTARVQVQVVRSGVTVLDWVDLATYRATRLADGDYLIHQRIADLAGNVGDASGADLTLRLDTHAAAVSAIQVSYSEDSNLAYQQDNFLNANETKVFSYLNLKLKFDEPIKGLTLANLALRVTGDGAKTPGLISVIALNPNDHGFATEWEAVVSYLQDLTQGATLQLVLVNGDGIVDQALNSGTSSYLAGPVLVVDREAALSVSSVMTEGRELLTAPAEGGYVPEVVFNGRVLTSGVHLSGRVSGVETGRPMSFKVVDSSGHELFVSTDGVVGEGGHWTHTLEVSELESLQNGQDYSIRVSVRDLAGNESVQTIQVQARLVAEIYITDVVTPNHRSIMTVTDATDTAISADDKSFAISDGGFLVNGITSIESGRTITLALVRSDGQRIVGTGGVIDSAGRWSVRFTQTQARNLIDSAYRLEASGTDASGNNATNDERIRNFIVDTQAGLSLDPVSDDDRINVTDDGNAVLVRGTFTDIESGRLLKLTLHDRENPALSWEFTDVVLQDDGTWSFVLGRAALNGVEWSKDANGKSELILEVSSTDAAGNTATAMRNLTLDRQAPYAPAAGVAVRQVAGATLAPEATQSLLRSTSLGDENQGVLLVPHLGDPVVTDITEVLIDAVAIDAVHDGWRLGSTQISLNTALASTVMNVNGVVVRVSFDAESHQLRIQAGDGSASGIVTFTASQVQQVLGQLAWVNSQVDTELDQMDRSFTLRYVDAFHNLSSPTTITVQVDTVAPHATGETNALALNPTTSSVSGQLLTNDTDVHDDHAPVNSVDHGVTVWDVHAGGLASSASAVRVTADGVTLSGVYGDLSLHSDGHYTYTRVHNRAATVALASGETGRDVFTYRVSDAFGNLSTAVTLTIDQVQGVNEAPQFLIQGADAATASLTQSASALTTHGTLTLLDTDVSNSVSVTVVDVAVSGTGIASIPDTSDWNHSALQSMFTLSGHNGNAADGTAGSLGWYFDSRAAVDWLREGQTVVLSYTVRATDSSAEHASTDQVVRITLTGVNDAVQIYSMAQPSAVTELTDASAQDIELIRGSITVIDVDIGDALILHASAPVVKLNGVDYVLPSTAATLIADAAFVIDVSTVSNGGLRTFGWFYNPSAARLDWLREGDRLTISYNITVSDGTSTTVSRPLVFTILGTNDAPVLNMNGGTIDGTTGRNLVFRKEPGSSDGSQALTLSTGGLNLTDVDSDNFSSLTVSVDNRVLAAGDQLRVVGVSTTVIDLTALASNGEVNVGGTVYAYSITDSGSQRTLTFTSLSAPGGVATAAPMTRFEQLIDALRYNQSSESLVSHGAQTLKFQVFDDKLLGSNVAQVVVKSQPILKTVVLTVDRSGVALSEGSTLASGDLVTVTATYDDAVSGSPTTAPTLTIGSETGIALVAGITSGSTRTWTYRVSGADTPDSGALRVVGNLTAGLTSMADSTLAVGGNPAQTGAFTANATAFTTLNSVALTPDGGTVVSNTLNNTNTSMGFSAVISAGEATGGRAEFYVNGVLVGTDSTIQAGDTQVTYSTSDGTPTAAELQAAVRTGGVVSVKLYDASNHVLSASGVTLVRDLVGPVLTSVTFSARRGGASLSSGSLLLAGDVVTVTAQYDDTVNGSLTTAPTLNIGTETGVALTAVVTSGSTRTWTYTISTAGTTDTGSLSVAGSLTTGLTDAAGNAVTGNPTPTGSFIADTTAPNLTSVTFTAQRDSTALASGSALKAGDVITVTARYDETVVGTLTAAPTLTIGSETGVVLTAGVTSGNTRTWTYTVSTSGSADTGLFSVSGSLTAGLTDAAGNAATGSPAASGNYTADTTAPVLTGVTFSAQRGGTSLVSGSLLKAGDVITVTAQYDDIVMGSLSTAPTLTIGSETGVALTAGVTSGNTRTWTYTISSADTTDTGAISLVGSLTTGLTDAAGNAATGSPASSGSYTADTTVTAPTLLLSSSSDSGASDSDQTLNASSFVLKGVAERGATVRVKQGSTLVGSATASSVDGSWSLTVTGQVTVAGLRAGASTANGTYTLLTATQAAALSAFNGDFSSTGTVALDLTKPVYQWVNGAETWYLWARQGKGYVISQANGTAEWYWEKTSGGSYATAPESISSEAWVLSNVSAATLALANPLNAVAQTGVAIVNLSGHGVHTYTATQTDLAGNDSEALSSGGSASLNITVDTLAPAAPALGSSQRNGVNATTGPAGITLFASIVTPASSDIQSVSIVLGGDGLDVSNDKITVGGLDRNLDSTISLVTGASLGGVSGVDWSYDSSTKTLVFKTHSGTAMAAADWLAVLSSLKFKTTSTVQGDRTFTLTYTDVAGNASTSSTQTITDDSLLPQLDLDTTQSGNGYSAQISAVATNIALTSSSGPALVTEANAVGKVTLTASNILDANEILVVGETQWAINGSGGNVSVTVNGQVWSGTYALSGSNHVWTLTNANSTSSADAQALIRVMFYRNNSASADLITGSARTFSLVLTDRANNDSTPAVTTLQLPDIVAPELDLNTGTGGRDNTMTLTSGFATARTLASAGALTTLVEATDAIAKVRLVVSGLLDGVNEKLLVGASTFNANGTTPPATVTVGAVVWNVSYDSANRAFNFTPNSGAPLTTANALALIQAIQYQNNAATPSDGGRLFSFTVMDRSLNVSSPAVASVVVNSALPTAASSSPLQAIDADGDGVKGDVFYLNFSEPVKVSLITTANLTLSGGATWGTGSVEAVSPLTLDGVQYASQFKVTKGTSNLTTGTTLTLVNTKVVDQAGSNATANVVFTMSDIVAPGTVTPPASVASDNYISATERAANTALSFTFTASSDNSKIHYYRDGVELSALAAAVTSSATSASINLSGAQWGASDGRVSITARLEDATGNLGTASTPKVVVVDTSVGSVSTVRMLTDASNNGVLDAGDTLQLSFNDTQGVNFTAAALTSGGWGSGATVSAIDGLVVSGTTYAKTWNITLGSGSTLTGGSSFTLGASATAANQVKDFAGNATSASAGISGTVSAGIASTTRVTSIGNVSADNVIDSTDGNTVSVTVNLAGAKNADTVQMYLDGELVGSANPSADGVSSVSIAVNKSVFGPDGTRQLTAKISGAASDFNSPLSREVYVAVDGTHWSQVGTGVNKSIWFNPDTLQSRTLGSRVTSYAASTGGATASASTGPVLSSINGHLALRFSGSAGEGLLYTDTNLVIQRMASGAQLSSFAVISVPTLPTSWNGIQAFSSLGPTPKGVKLGAYLSKLVYTSYSVADYFSPDNTINAYTSSVIDLVVSYASGTTSLTGNLDGRSVISTSTTVDTSSIVKMSIGSELNASATENLVWNGQMGDSIWLGYAASTAARQEIQTYLAVKYATMGVVVNATSALAAASVGTSVTGYDLSNNNSSVLIDQVLDTSAAGAVRDVVLTGGPDVVNVGAGDDTVYLHDLSFRQIDGGKGNDTLVLAADYAGSSALVLSDFVSNARANTNGWHKLWGFENLDASLSASKQLLTVTAADINQLSETNTFAVTLGSNDVIKPYTGLTGVVQLGLWTVNGSYYDRFWSGTDSGQTINLYAKSGVLAPGLTSATLNTTTSVTVVMDQAVDTTSVVAQADFSIETGGTTVTGITSTPASNQLSLTLGTAVSGGILGLSYTASGNGWMSTDGVKVSFTKWYIGDASGNTIDRSSETSARLVLMGNLGDDVIQGGAKSDLIVGGVGNDTLTGNGGGDVFRWDLGNTGTDTITDFNAAKSDVGALGTADRLDLRGVLSTTGLTATNLTANLANYVSLVRGGPGVVSSSSTTLNDAVLKVDINADGTAEQSIVLQSAWTSLQGMTDVSGAAIGSGSPTSSQMLMELVQRGQLMVV